MKEKKSRIDLENVKMQKILLLLLLLWIAKGVYEMWGYESMRYYANLEYALFFREGWRVRVRLSWVEFVRIVCVCVELNAYCVKQKKGYWVLQE